MDLTKRQLINCPDCNGTGTKLYYHIRFPASLQDYAYDDNCNVCLGAGKVLESLESQINRLTQMVNWFIDELSGYYIGKTDEEAKNYIMECFNKSN